MHAMRPICTSYSFIWNQLNEQDRNMRTKGVSVSYRPLLGLFCVAVPSCCTCDSERPHRSVSGQNVPTSVGKQPAVETSGNGRNRPRGKIVQKKLDRTPTCDIYRQTDRLKAIFRTRATLCCGR